MAGALPYAVGVAISPIPIATVVVILSGRGGRSMAMLFGGGWTFGIALCAAAVTVLVNELGITDSQPAWIGATEIAFGIACLAVASRLWWTRRESQPTTPWLAAAGRFTPAGSMTLGILLSIANPKIVALSLAAALSVAQTNADTSTTASMTGLFVAIGAIGVALPIAASFIFPTQSAAGLGRLHRWLERRGGIVLIAAGLAIGLLFVRDGLGSVT